VSPRRATPTRPAPPAAGTPSGPDPPSARGPASPADPRPGSPAPGLPAGSDPWAWLTLLAVLPLAARMAGAPWGEPVAEDFDFLHRALLQGMGSLLDGGGSQAFWRPIPHQLYYAVFGRLILGAPALVAVFHLACLAAAALLLQRALRPALGGALACVAATFPLLAESTRTLASWPTQFVDVGLALGGALAVYAAARRRHALALAGLALALLCKEVAVAVGLLLPFVPGAARDRRERVRFAAGSAAVLTAWGLATWLVRSRAGLALPRHIVETGEALRASWLEKLGWALAGNLRASVSLSRLPGPDDAPLALAAGALAAAAVVVLLARRAARARLARLAPWGAWGLVWFALGTAAITPIFPAWQPNRSHLAGMGLGVATTAALGAAHPALPVALAGVRIVALARAPGPTRRVETRPAASGAFMDYAKLTRLQVFMRATRRTLSRDHPTLPPGGVVVQQNLPHGVEYAFGGDHALQVWYRNPTLRWMRYDAFRESADRAATVLLQAQPGREPPVALVQVEAIRGLLRGQSLVSEGRAADVISALDRADSAQRDTFAIEYRVKSGAMRAWALSALGRPGEAEAVAGRALALDRGSSVARQVLAVALAEQGRFVEAWAHLDTLKVRDPGSEATPIFDRRVRELAARGRPALRAGEPPGPRRP